MSKFTEGETKFSDLSDDEKKTYEELKVLFNSMTEVFTNLCSVYNAYCSNSNRHNYKLLTNICEMVEAQIDIYYKKYTTAMKDNFIFSEYMWDCDGYHFMLGQMSYEISQIIKKEEIEKEEKMLYNICCLVNEFKIIAQFYKIELPTMNM
jgi:hypothetical protein